jgi:hypothetical protein
VLIGSFSNVDSMSQPNDPYRPSQYPAFKGRSWVRRYRFLTSLIAFGALTGMGGILQAAGDEKPQAQVAPAPTVTVAATANAKATVKASAAAAVRATISPSVRPSPSPSAKPSTPASPSCLTQVRAWISGGSSQEIGALQSDFSSFSAAARTFVTDTADGGASAPDVSAVQSAAANIQADAQEVEANPAPACVPGMRPALMAAATDYQKAAIDAGNAMGQYSAGADGSAIADLQAADVASNNGDNEIAAATTATEKFDN